MHDSQSSQHNLRIMRQTRHSLGNFKLLPDVHHDFFNQPWSRNIKKKLLHCTLHPSFGLGMMSCALRSFSCTRTCGVPFTTSPNSFTIQCSGTSTTVQQERSPCTQSVHGSTGWTGTSTRFSTYSVRATCQLPRVTHMTSIQNKSDTRCQSHTTVHFDHLLENLWNGHVPYLFREPHDRAHL